MKRLDPTRNAGKLLAGASLMLGLWIGPVDGALAAERPCYPCPPTYKSPASPYYSPSPTPARPGDAPAPPAPGDMGPNMGDPARRQDQPQQQDQAQQPTDLSQSSDSSRANPSPGMNTPQLGRLDQANRLNLFDNMTAAPQNKVWFGLQYSSGITSGLEAYDAAALAILGSSNPVLAEQKQINYRVGAEVLLTCETSIAVQGQYFTNETHDGPFGDDFSSPQIMLKHVLARDCDTVLSATLGITPETNVDFGDLDENTTKLYPGVLYYETLSPTLFTQGGFQFGIPVEEDQITTFDWSISLGYWLYQDCSLSHGNCCCNRGQITGIIPQVGLLGKHVLGDDERLNAFGIPSGTQPIGGAPILIYREPEDVLDLTVGTLIMIGSDVQVGVGYSLPITDDSTRENEFLSYVNYLF
jgi:hypothetical protein